MAYIYSLADTWADGATTFKGISLNVTDTASAAGSLLMDLQVGGTSRFKVDKSGVVTLGGSAGFAKQVASDYLEATTGWSVSAGANTGCTMQSGGFVAGPNASFAFGNANGAGTRDVFLTRDAANTLAQRNGVNAQAFNLYNTYTDASNYERGFMRWVSNELRIGNEGAGTGSSRGMAISGSLYINLNIGAANKFGVGGSTNLSYQPLVMQGYIEFLEQTAPAAPATDRVRIYAEDDGAGKTRLMARFATGAAVQLAIEP